MLALLHVHEPEFDPSWRMISEYELGRYGWLMQIAFFSLALGCLAVVAGVQPYVKTRSGRPGLALLAIVAVIGAGAGAFITDPITMPADAATVSGNLHSLCGVVFMLGFPVAITLIGRSLASNPAWTAMRRWLPWMSAIVWLGCALMFGSLILFAPGNSGYGPDALIGWPDRFLAVANASWLVIVAWYAGWRTSHK
jgi:hypothetical protein